MITIKINNSEIRVCESTANVAVTKLDKISINEIADLISSNNYICKIIYDSSENAISLASMVGGEITKKYDVLEKYLNDFE